MKKARSPLAEAYFRFLQLAKTFQADPSTAAMDANERTLLDAVALCWFEDRPMTVREAIALDYLGSPATLHKRISRLRKKDMLVAFNQEGDRRAKYLIPSEKTLKMFAELGGNMQKVHQPANAQ
jgi:hypothetical protein